MSGWSQIVHQVNGAEASFLIDTRIYTLSSVLKASYVLIDKAYIYLESAEENRIKASVKSKGQAVSGEQIAGEFLNELLNQCLQEQIDKETGRIRELLVARAFSDVVVRDAGRSEQSRKSSSSDSARGQTYKEDGENIARLQGQQE